MCPNVSACIIVENEEDALPGCLKSIHGVVDEIIIIDSHSTDQTVKIANEYDSKIYQFEDYNHFDEKRNFSFKKATSEWILWIDADERLSPELASNIQKLINSKDVIYEIPIEDEILDTGGSSPGSGRLSLFPKGMLWFEENPKSPPLDKHILGEVEYIPYPIIHCQRENHKLVTPTQVLDRASMFAKNTPKSHHSFYYYILSPYVFVKNLAKQTIIRKKYKDGRLGIKMAFLISIKKFLTFLFIGVKPEDKEVWKEWVDNPDRSYEENRE